MQTKKDDIREQILKTAQKEFLLHGYEGASMRVIARKANTTLGNIYHYFPNKEAILDEILKEPLEGLNKLVDSHFKEQMQVYTFQELKEALDSMEDMMDYEEFRYLMDERLLILFDLRTTKYVAYREQIITEFKNHMAWHLRLTDSDSAYVDIITNMFISCMRHVLTEHDNVEEAKREFVKVFKMLCSGLVINKEEEDTAR